MQQIMRKSDQSPVALRDHGAERFERIEKAPPGRVRDLGGKAGLVEGQVALPQRRPRRAIAWASSAIESTVVAPAKRPSRSRFSRSIGRG